MYRLDELDCLCVTLRRINSACLEIMLFGWLEPTVTAATSLLSIFPLPTSKTLPYPRKVFQSLTCQQLAMSKAVPSIGSSEAHQVVVVPSLANEMWLLRRGVRSSAAANGDS